jgi:anti-sigma B factor antagonist
MPQTLVLSDSTADRADAPPREDAPPPAFVCSWTDGGLDAAWVHVTGALDFATLPVLVRTLRLPQLQAQLLVLDLRELRFISSAGVHAIVNATIRARQAGRRLILLRGPANVDRMFTVTGSSDVVEIGDVDPVEIPAQPLLALAVEDLDP